MPRTSTPSTPPHCGPTWRRRARTPWRSVMSSAAAPCRNRSACWTSSRTTHRLVDGPDSGIDTGVALQFLLQTLAALDVATRGFIDGTRRYEQQRARADDLADRDEFRTALVNSLQEGFFVADRNGAVIEINDAFADITGYGPEGLPYAWPHPWIADDDGSNARLGRLLAQGTLEGEAAIRHRDGHIVWVATSVNAVTSPRRRRGHLRRNHSRHHCRAGRGRTGACGRPPRHGCQRGQGRRRGAVGDTRRVPHHARRRGESRPSCGRRTSMTRPSTLRERRLRRSGMTSTHRCAGHSRTPARGCLSPSSRSDGQPKPTPQTASWPHSRGTSRCGSSSVNPAGSASRTGSSSSPLSDTSASRCSISASSSSPVTHR